MMRGRPVGEDRVACEALGIVFRRDSRHPSRYPSSNCFAIDKDGLYRQFASREAAKRVARMGYVLGTLTGMQIDADKQWETGDGSGILGRERLLKSPDYLPPPNQMTPKALDQARKRVENRGALPDAARGGMFRTHRLEAPPAQIALAGPVDGGAGALAGEDDRRTSSGTSSSTDTALAEDSLAAAGAGAGVGAAAPAPPTAPLAAPRPLPPLDAPPPVRPRCSRRGALPTSTRCTLGAAGGALGLMQSTARCGEEAIRAQGFVRSPVVRPSV